jgi:hypothetical protein
LFVRCEGANVAFFEKLQPFTEIAPHMLRLFLGFIVGCILQPIGYGVNAQVINIESRRMDAAQEGWAGQGEFGYAYIQNQSSISNLNTRLNILYNKQKHTCIFLGDLSLIQSSEGDFENAGYEHIRYNYDKTDRLIYEAYTQVQFSKQLRLYPRYVIGAGPRYKIYKTDSVKIFAGGSLLFEHEQLQNPSEVMSNERLTGYFSCIFTKIPNVTIDIMLMYQPRLVDFSDARFQSEVRLDFPFSSHLLFRCSGSVYIDSKPPAGVPPNYTQVRNSILYNF